MKTHRSHWRRTQHCLLLAAAVALPQVTNAQLVTNWIAFNDHGPSASTAAYVSPYNMRGGISGADAANLYPTQGPLTNFLAGAMPAGQQLVAQMVVTTQGGVAQNFVNAAMGYPDVGTPAFDLFNGIVDLGNSPGGIGLTAGQKIIVTFTGLDPAMRYSLRGTAVRNGVAFGGNHPGRWTTCAIEGADSFADAHTAGCLTSLTPLPDYTRPDGLAFPATNLPPGRAVFQSGMNTQGNMVGWDDIRPGADGTFSYTSEAWTRQVTNLFQNIAPSDNSVLITNAWDNLGYPPIALRLVEYGPLTPVSIVTQPPSTTTLSELYPLTLSVTAFGSAPLYQWYKDTVAIPGANGATYSIPSAAVEDSGVYTVTVGNSLGSLTSSQAQVTVLDDAVKPTAVNAIAGGTFSQVTVQFSERVSVADAAFSFNYALVGGIDPSGVSVLSPGTTDIGTVVVLTFDPPLVEDTVYQLKISNIADLAGNVADENQTFSFRTWMVTAAGGVKFDVFTGIGGNAVSGLVSHPSFPNSPTVTTNLTTFDSREFLPTDSLESYGGRMRGMFFPQVSGAYIFFLTADDGSELYLNPNGPNPAGKTLIQSRVDCCASFAANPSAPQNLTAGQAYYIESLYKEGGGGDICRVAVKLASDPTDPATLSPIAGAFLGYPSAPAGAAGTVTLTQQPASIVTNENQLVTFTVGAINTYGLPMTVQWYKNGDLVPGVSGLSYSFLAVRADNAATIQAVVSIVGSKVSSSVANLTVNSDEVRPLIVSAKADSSFTKLIVQFNELITLESAQSSFGYEITAGPNLPGIPSAILQPDGKTVVINLNASLVENSTYTLLVSEATDIAGNTIASGSTVQIQSWKVTPGFVTFETYNTPEAGVEISKLTSAPSFPDNPRETFYIRSFNTTEAYPDNSHEQFGGRLSGVFIPPTTGNWIFYISSDDSSQLFLNPTGKEAAGKTLVQEETACCKPYSDHATAAYPMVAGQAYYIEAIYKEGGGGDYCRVAAKLDTDPTDPNTLPAIPASMLGTFVNPVGLSLAITQNPTDQVGVVSSPGKVLLSQDFGADNGGFTVVNNGAATGPWTYDTARKSWSAAGANASSSLLSSPTMTVTEAGPVVLTFNHRYNFEADSVRWDGGQVRLSVNGGAYVAVPATSFSANGYKTDIVIGGNNLLNGQYAFNDISAGWNGGAYIQSIAALGSFNVGDQLSLQFVAAWDEGTINPAPNWEVDKIVVNEGVFPLYAQDFAASNGAFTVTNLGTVAGPWVYNVGTGTWSANGGEGIVASFLNSPAITVTKDGFVKLTFSHRYNFEDGSTLWDGGQVRVSVNGGPYATVPATSFATNGYATGLFIGNGIILGQRGFNGTSAGFATNGFITSIASLGAFQAGDTVSVQFAGSWDDGFVQPPSPNWEIDTVNLDDGIAVPVTFSVAATAIVPGASVTPIAYQWQKDSGTGFADLIGATSSNLTFFVVEADNGTHYRCVVSVPGTNVVSGSALLTVGAGAPALSVVRTGGSVVISWPAPSTGYVLEQTAELLTPATTVWTPVGIAPTVSGGVNTVTISGAGVGLKFYRLKN